MAYFVRDEIFIEREAVVGGHPGQDRGSLFGAALGNILASFDQDKIGEVLIKRGSLFQIGNGAELQTCRLDGRGRSGNPSWPLLKKTLCVSVGERDGGNASLRKLKEDRVLANDLQQ